MAASRPEIVHAYRQLFKHCMRAVQYSKPARFVVQERMRAAFRDSSAADFDASRIARTLEFLDSAARVKGTAHKILKNLVHVRWEQAKLMRSSSRPDVLPFRRRAFDQFDQRIERLNSTMGLCLR